MHACLNLFNMHMTLVLIFFALSAAWAQASYDVNGRFAAKVNKMEIKFMAMEEAYKELRKRTLVK